MFIPWPEHRFSRHLERHGHALRQRASLGPLQMLEPAEIVKSHPDIILADFLALAAGWPAAALELVKQASEQWSALAMRVDGAPWLVASNPWHSAARQRVSLMEEVAHIVLDHKPVAFTPDPLTGLPVRNYSPSKEKEAYGVAGAAVVPYAGLVQLLRQGMTEAEIAEQYGVSVPLVTMRINVTKARVASGGALPSIAPLAANRSPRGQARRDKLA